MQKEKNDKVTVLALSKNIEARRYGWLLPPWWSEKSRVIFADIMTFYTDYKGVRHKEMQRLWYDADSDPSRNLRDGTIPKRYQGLVMRLLNYFPLSSLRDCKFVNYHKPAGLKPSANWSYIYGASPGIIAAANYVAEAIGRTSKEQSSNVEYEQLYYGRPIVITVNDSGEPVFNPVW